MFKNIKTGIIIILTGTMLASAPVRASAEEPTEIPVSTETEITETEMVPDTGTETDAAFSSGEEVIKADPLPTYDGSIQVVYGVSFDDGSFDTWATTMGVMVNQNTVICNDISKTDFTETTRDRTQGYAALGMNPLAAELSFRLYDGRELKEITDVVYETVEINGETNEILILKSAESIKNPDGSDKTIHLSPGGSINDSELFVTGYTQISPNYYVTQDDLLIQTLRVTDSGDTFYLFSSNAQFITDSSAIINGYNEICGFIPQNGTAINIDTIKQILDRNGVFFETSAPAYTIDRTGLGKLYETLPETDDEEKYTEESWNLYLTKREAAEKVLNEKITTQDVIDAALEEYQTAYDQLVEAPRKINYILITVISLIALFLLFGLYVFIRWKKDHNYIYKLLGIHKKSVPDTNKGTVVAGGIFEDTPIPQLEEPAPQKQVQRPQYTASYAVNTDSNTDVRIEKSGSHSTSNSSKLRKEGPVLLIREDTNERISLKKNHFVIGRLQTCDYSIPDNDAVSKEHCRIFSIDGIYHITDSSTNGTYLNGTLIPKQSPTIIKSHDKIAVSNIIFEFINKNEAESPSYQEYEEPKQEAFDDVYEASTGVLTETKKNACLIWRGIRYNINTSPFSVGRSRYANLQISKDINVSREHIIITEESGGYYSIYDNDATNDTVLNGYVIEPLKKYVLEDGATIQILNEVLTFSKQGG